MPFKLIRIQEASEGVIKSSEFMMANVRKWLWKSFLNLLFKIRCPEYQISELMKKPLWPTITGMLGTDLQNNETRISSSICLFY